MAKLILIEAQPLIRLGMAGVLQPLNDDAFLQSCGPHDPERAALAGSAPDIMIYGMSGDGTHDWPHLHHAQQEIAPRRVLLLPDTVTHDLLRDAHANDTIAGCVAKNATPAEIKAAIMMIDAGGECFPRCRRRVLNDGGPVRRSRAGAGGGTGSVFHDTRWPVEAGSPERAQFQSIADQADALDVTPRQFEVLSLLAKGHPIKTVARRMEISVATAKTHASSLYQRLGVTNKTQAVYVARQRGVQFDEPPA